MRRSILAGVIAAAVSVPPMAHARLFACEREEWADPDLKSNISRIAHNRTMEVIVNEYRYRWDAAYMRQQCGAFAEGRPYDFGCIKQHRDWAAIRASIPAEYFHLDDRTLRPLMLAEQAEGNPLGEARKFCRSVGAR